MPQGDDIAEDAQTRQHQKNNPEQQPPPERTSLNTVHTAGNNLIYPRLIFWRQFACHGATSIIWNGQNLGDQEGGRKRNGRLRPTIEQRTYSWSVVINADIQQATIDIDVATTQIGRASCRERVEM